MPISTRSGSPTTERGAGIDVVLTHTQSWVEYLTDCVWVHHFNKDSFLLEDGKSNYRSVVGLPQQESKGPFCVGCSTEIG